MNNEHEGIVRALSERSLGSEFVFEPDVIIRGEEPADLVWACNNTVVLMYMTERKVYPSTDKNNRVREAAMAHNIGQARKWLKGWKGGKIIRGKNHRRHFFIPFSDEYNVVILSVIQCAEPIVRFEDKVAAEFGVRCCATVPHSLIAGLAVRGGTALDLVLLLTALRGRAEATELAELEALACLEVYCTSCAIEAGVTSYQAPFQLDGRRRTAGRLVRGVMGAKLGVLPAQSPDVTTGMQPLRSYYNDMHLGDLISAAERLHQAIQEIQAKPNNVHVTLVTRLRDYDFAICIIPFLSDQMVQYCLTSHIHLIDMTRAGEIREGPRMVYDYGYHVAMVLGVSPTILSRTERLLGQWSGNRPGSLSV